MAQLQFEHVVVLMLENRSFDHVFGYLRKGDGIGALGGATNYLEPGNAQSQAFSSREGGDYTASGSGPSHSHKQTNEQLFGVTEPTPQVEAGVPPMNGFVASLKTSLQAANHNQPFALSELQEAMNCFDPVQLPVLSALAREYVLCDRWFADMPGPTMPNRAFVHAATSQGYTDNADWKPEFTCKTLYDRIDGADKLSWRVYKHDQDDVVEMYHLSGDTTNHAPFSTYAADVAGDSLATYSFIIPAFFGQSGTVNSMHAPQDVRPADKLVADVYSALCESVDVFKKTLLIVVFDEHGGYYDHVPPPATVSPDGIPGRLDKPYLVEFNFERLGLRVPCILISPWFEAAVDSTVYSHSTIPGSVIEAFDLPGGFLTDRDKDAKKLTTYFTYDAARVWRAPPAVTVGVQPQALDLIQRQMLGGAALADPDPAKQTTARTDDIQDPVQAQHFVQTQFAKRLEHSIAVAKLGRALPTGSAYNQLPSTTVSPARIAELQRPADPPPREP